MILLYVYSRFFEECKKKVVSRKFKTKVKSKKKRSPQRGDRF